jgi:hypothetical protein
VTGGKKKSGGEQDRCTEEGRRAPGHRSTGERRSLSRDVGHPQEGMEGGSDIREKALIVGLLRGERRAAPKREWRQGTHTQSD